MSNETIVENDAGEATSNTANGSSRALTGKISQLPKDIREEFNRRIEDGQPASVILPWVNGLPATKKILEAHFDGLPINERNLSVWRHHGHKRWLEKQESLAELKELAENAKEYSDATGGTLARGAASIATAKILKTLHEIPATPDSLEALTKISYAVTALMNAEQAQVRLEYEKTRVFQGNERLVLSWDKFLRSRVETAQRALEDAICKDIQAADIDNGEKIELLGYELFGRKWKGRKVKEQEAPKKGAEEPKNSPSENAEVKKADVQTAQVRPTVASDKSMEAGEKIEEVNVSGDLTTAATTAEAEKTGAKPVEPRVPAVKNVEKGQKDNGGDFTIAATGACAPAETKGAEPVKPKAGLAPQSAMKEDQRRSHETPLRPNGGEGNSGARPATPPNLKPLPPAKELSPYEKAINGGQTFLSALYAQFSKVESKPKPQEDPSVPKPSAWDSFSEPVKKPTFTYRPEPLRPAPGFNTLG